MNSMKDEIELDEMQERSKAAPDSCVRWKLDQLERMIKKLMEKERQPLVQEWLRLMQSCGDSEEGEHSLVISKENLLFLRIYTQILPACLSTLQSWPADAWSWLKEEQFQSAQIAFCHSLIRERRLYVLVHVEQELGYSLLPAYLEQLNLSELSFLCKQLTAQNQWTLLLYLRTRMKEKNNLPTFEILEDCVYGKSVCKESSALRLLSCATLCDPDTVDGVCLSLHLHFLESYYRRKISDFVSQMYKASISKKESLSWIETNSSDAMWSLLSYSLFHEQALDLLYCLLQAERLDVVHHWRKILDYSLAPLLEEEVETEPKRLPSFMRALKRERSWMGLLYLHLFAPDHVKPLLPPLSKLISKVCPSSELHSNSSLRVEECAAALFTSSSSELFQPVLREMQRSREPPSEAISPPEVELPLTKEEEKEQDVPPSTREEEEETKAFMSCLYRTDAYLFVDKVLSSSLENIQQLPEEEWELLREEGDCLAPKVKLCEELLKARRLYVLVYMEEERDCPFLTAYFESLTQDSVEALLKKLFAERQLPLLYYLSCKLSWEKKEKFLTEFADLRMRIARAHPTTAFALSLASYTLKKDPDAAQNGIWLSLLLHLNEALSRQLFSEFVLAVQCSNLQQLRTLPELSWRATAESLFRPEARQLLAHLLLRERLSAIEYWAQKVGPHPLLFLFEEEYEEQLPLLLRHLEQQQSWHVLMYMRGKAPQQHQPLFPNEDTATRLLSVEKGNWYRLKLVLKELTRKADPDSEHWRDSEPAFFEDNTVPDWKRGVLQKFIEKVKSTPLSEIRQWKDRKWNMLKEAAFSTLREELFVYLMQRERLGLLHHLATKLGFTFGPVVSEMKEEQVEALIHHLVQQKSWQMIIYLRRWAFSRLPNHFPPTSAMLSYFRVESTGLKFATALKVQCVERDPDAADWLDNSPCTFAIVESWSPL